MRYIAQIPLLCLVLLTSACSRETESCDCDCDKKEAVPSVHALRGVVTGIRKESSSLLVKHEEIPGFMKAMTMQYKVTETDLGRVRVGDQITAEMSRRGDDWVLEKINVLPASP